MGLGLRLLIGLGLWMEAELTVVLMHEEVGGATLGRRRVAAPATRGTRTRTFSTRRILFIQATTSCDDGLAGLSKLMHPYLTYSSSGRLSGEQPLGMGV